jgi:hypothetical protein
MKYPEVHCMTLIYMFKYLQELVYTTRYPQNKRKGSTEAVCLHGLVLNKGQFYLHYIESLEGKQLI